MIKTISRSLFLLFTIIFITTACANNEKNEQIIDGEQLKVITSFTLLEDIAGEIGGDQVNVYNLVPSGTDPHIYSPLPDDIKAVTDADILFYNGFNLEGGEQGWFAKMIESTNQDWDRAYRVTENVEPLYIHSEDGRQEEINPHSFLDPTVGIEMVQNIRDAFIEIDPNNENIYNENAQKYIEQLEEMDAQYKEKINLIPEENRVLVTSERAYQYVAKRYGLTEGYIWAIDTEENGSSEQITALLKFLKEHEPPVLFIETNVDRRPMETISAESGIEIYGELYSDEIGTPGEDGDTYLNYLQYNIDMIYEGLKSKE